MHILSALQDLQDLQDLQELQDLQNLLKDLQIIKIKYNSTYHSLKRVLLIVFLGFLEDGFKQQCVFCQPLHWPHQDVNQPQAVAVLLRFAPLHRSDIGYLFKVHYGSMGC